MSDIDHEIDWILSINFNCHKSYIILIFVFIYFW